MTREEVIKALIKERKTALHENKQAFDMAIKALEQEPSEDCVSRQAVLEIVNDWWGITSTSGEPTLCDCIRELPSVAPTRKKGKWIGHGKHCENLGVIPSGLGVYEWCSNCDCGIDVREWHRNHYNYCPNCGAEMER